MATGDSGQLQRTQGSGELVVRDQDLPAEVKAEELRRSIEATRQQISASLADIQHNLESGLDWRGWVDEHPLETVGIAFAVGFYFGIR